MGSDGVAWDLSSVEPPWRADAPSIHDHIRDHLLDGSGRLAPGGWRLPDEKDDDRLRWSAGALDGVFGDHVGVDVDRARARMLHRAIAVVLEDAAPARLAALYGQLLAGSTLQVIDALLPLVHADEELDVARLAQLAVWLATRSTDREPVKLAIGLLGILPGAGQLDLLITLGRHEELTLYAATAIARRPDAQQLLFELARHATGWGRIQTVRRLAAMARDPAVKAWMVREGFRNSIMDEYLAHTCAVAGDLRAELDRDEADAALVARAGGILAALIMGGPAEAPELRASLRASILVLEALPRWRSMAEAGLASDDPDAFHVATRAAKRLGMDPWDAQFARLRAGSGADWYAVMQTDDPARIDRVVDLAERVLPLDRIATGPARALGLGSAWADHGHLDFVLQDLRRFPGKGWPLIRAGLRSPVVRNRGMAVLALAAWDRSRWPPDARAVLEAARAEEPDDRVRESIEAALSGQAAATRP